MAIPDRAATKHVRDALLLNERIQSSYREAKSLTAQWVAGELETHPIVVAGAQGVTGAEAQAVVDAMEAFVAWYEANMQTAAEQASVGFKAQ